MDSVVSLLERPVYGIREVDDVLGLPAGTARRWIEGYQRIKAYPPVVRVEATGSDIVTWGEFVETRLLAETSSGSSTRLPTRPHGWNRMAMSSSDECRMRRPPTGASVSSS